MNKFHETKLYSNDKKIVSMYAELCGVSTVEEYSEDFIGFFYTSEIGYVASFQNGYAIDKNPSLRTVTEEEVVAAFNNCGGAWQWKLIKKHPGIMRAPKSFDDGSSIEINEFYNKDQAERLALDILEAIRG